MIMLAKDIASRAPQALISDAIGLAAICVVLLVGLSLPGLV